MSKCIVQVFYRGSLRSERRGRVDPLHIGYICQTRRKKFIVGKTIDIEDAYPFDNPIDAAEAITKVLEGWHLNDPIGQPTFMTIPMPVKKRRKPN